MRNLFELDPSVVSLPQDDEEGGIAGWRVKGLIRGGGTGEEIDLGRRVKGSESLKTPSRGARPLG